MKIINLKLNDKTAYFELFEEEAPITSKRLLEILPVKMDIHYAKFAGQEVFGVVPMMAPIEGGKSLKEIDRGCVAFYPDRAFFCIYYGDLQDEEVSITVIGQLYAYNKNSGRAVDYNGLIPGGNNYTYSVSQAIKINDHIDLMIQEFKKIIDIEISKPEINMDKNKILKQD